MVVLLLGASGTLGRACARVFGESLELLALTRSPSRDPLWPRSVRHVGSIDVADSTALNAVIRKSRPSAIVNCVGVLKQEAAINPSRALALNGELPHALLRLAYENSSQLIHISTDCVFDGRRGSYTETDHPNAQDVYGQTKALGELAGSAVTLRTSFIGHEAQGQRRGLLSWLLSQCGTVGGYTNAKFSGLTALALAETIRDHVLTRRELRGIYNVAGQTIDKFRLLRMLAAAYHLPIEVQEDPSVAIDRSLNATLFRAATGFVAPDWTSMISSMRDFG